MTGSEIEVIRGVVLSPLDELALEANRQHTFCRESAYSMVQHALAAGQALLDAKQQVAHGEWLPWLEENFAASRQTAADYMRIADNADVVTSLHSDRLSINAVLKRLARVGREAESLELAAVSSDGGVEVRHGDLRSTLDDLTGSVDAIVTDPPYSAEFLDEFDALADVAARLLKPDGLLVAMVGQSHLLQYLERLSERLTYRWCGAYLMDGPAVRVFGRQVGSKWKPLLIFGGDEFLTQDVFRSRSDDKEHHDWGQSESGMADIIERLTKPGELVVDPFLGGGTTAVVCRDLGRRFVGCDIDANAVRTTRERLA